MAPRGDSPAMLAPVVLGRLPAAAIIRHPAWDAARRGVTERLDAGLPLVAVLGIPGVGKTALLGHLARELRRRGRTVRSRRVDGSALPDDLPALAAPANGPAPVAILDDAQDIPDATLLTLHEVGGAALLAGPPELEGRLLDLGLGFAPIALRPLRPEEIPDFVAARLTASGQPPDLLGPDAIEELFARSGGVIRLLNGLVRSALFSASLEDAPHVTARHIAEAAEPGPGVRPAGPKGITVTESAGDEPLVTRAVIRAAPPPVTEVPAPLSEPPAVVVEEGSRLATRATIRAGSVPDESSDATPPDAGPGPSRVAAVPEPSGTLLPPVPAQPSEGSALPGPGTPPVAAGVAAIRGRRGSDAPRSNLLNRLRATAPLAPRDPPRSAPFRQAAVVAGLVLLGAGAAAWLTSGAVPQATREAEATAEWAEPPAREPPSEMIAAGPVPAETAPPAPRPATANTTPARAPLPRPSPPTVASSATSPPAQVVPGAPRIVLHRPEGSAMAESGAASATAILAPGFGAVETRAVRGGPRVPTIRYFYEGDATTAGRVARSLPGGPWRVQDMTSFRPLPRPGTVEVWFPS